MSQRGSIRGTGVALAAASMLIVLIAVFLVGRSSSAVGYSVVDLATLPQGSTMVVRGPNRAGAVVGGARGAGGHAAQIFAAGRAQPLAGLPASDHATAFGINDLGTIVGAANGA